MVLAADGKIVVIRQVPPRPAYRQGPPGPAVEVSTTPRIDLSATGRISPTVLDAVPNAEIISDGEAAAIAGGAAPLQPQPSSGGLTGLAAGEGARRTGGTDVRGQFGALQSLGTIPTQVGAAGRSVSRATSGLSNTVRRALGQQ